MKAETTSRLSIVGAALLWSTGGAAIKLSAATAPQLAWGRAVIAALALAIALPSARRRPTPRILVTAVFYALTCTLFVYANTLTTAGNAIFIQNMAPIWVLLASPWLLAEVPTRAERISVPISLLGSALFFLDDVSPGRLAGNLCAAGASLTYAMLIMMYRRTSEEEGLAATIVGNVLIGVALLAPTLSGPELSLRDLSVFAYLGLIQQALAALLFIRGIRGVTALEGALLILFEPLFSPIFALLFVGEALGPLAILGAVVVLGATIVRVHAARPRAAT